MRRGITLVFLLRVGIIQTASCTHVQVIGNFIFQRCIQHVAVFHLRTQIAVSHPVRVLHSHTEVARCPRLHIVAQLGIIAFEILFLLKILSARIQISSQKRVEIRTVGQHVVVILTHVAGRQVHGQLIVEELGSISHHGIVSVVFVVGHDTLGIDRRTGHIRLILVISHRQIKRVGKSGSGIEEVGRII